MTERQVPCKFCGFKGKEPLREIPMEFNKGRVSGLSNSLICSPAWKSARHIISSNKDEFNESPAEKAQKGHQRRWEGE